MQNCGECTLSKTFGFCTYTRCSKGLLNGPCGGQLNGKCEVSPDKDCIWVKIYEYLEEIGETKKLLDIHIIKDYSKARKPNIMKGYKLIDDDKE